ncbi:MAG: TIGR01244 family protein [Robiginitomaculum sp.]|nr:MAG: TIGR01244 family protein [Robiginitomaculum sp.]
MLETSQIDLHPVEVTPDFSVSGQIYPGHIPAIKQLGFTRILAVRPDNEEDADEQPPRFLLEPEVLAAGLQFSHIPIESGIAFPEIAIRGAAHLFAEAPQKTLAFCLTGIRSLRLWALGNALAGTLPPDEIHQAALAAGFDLTQFSTHLKRLALKQAPYYVADDYANLI